MPINGIISDISDEGIYVSGTPFGGTYPNLGQLLNKTQDNIQISARVIQVAAPVSVGGNSSFSIPISYGKNKFIVSVNKDLYCPFIDFVPSPTSVKWINPNITVSTTDVVELWGPLNDYTADLITIEAIDMLGPKFNSGLQTITLEGNGGGLSLPSSGKDLYLVVDHKLYSHNTHFTFSNNTITWILPSLLNTSSKVFAFYFNKNSSVPYTLPSSNVRTDLTATSNGQTEFLLSVIPKQSQVKASIVGVNTSKLTYAVDYTINYPKLKLFSGVPINTKLDVSYIKNVEQALQMFNNTTTGVNANLAVDGKIEIPITNTPVTNPLGLFFISGGLQVGPSYTKITVQPPQIFVPEYQKVGNKIRFDPNAQSYRNVYPMDISIEDSLVWLGFTDALAGTHVKLEYFRGYGGVGDVKTLDAPPVDTNKVIVWVDGSAFFTQSGEVNVVNDQVNINAPYLTEDPQADIIVMYFTDASYAAQWTFSTVDVTSNVWGSGVVIPLSKEMSSNNNAMLYKNGRLVTPGDYVKEGSGIKNVSMDTTYGLSSSYPDELIIVYT
jgi:hypothetical protein